MCFFSMFQRYLRLSKEIEFVLDEIEKIVAESNGFSSGYKETTPGTLNLEDLAPYCTIFIMDREYL